MNKIRKPVTDRNGKETHVWVNPDEAPVAADSRAADVPAAPPTLPIGGHVIREGMTHKDFVLVDELGAKLDNIYSTEDFGDIKLAPVKRLDFQYTIDDRDQPVEIELNAVAFEDGKSFAHDANGLAERGIFSEASFAFDDFTKKVSNIEAFRDGADEDGSQSYIVYIGSVHFSEP